MLTLLLALAAAADDPPRGLSDEVPIYKWSAPALPRGGWVAGAQVVAHGLTARTTVAVEPTSAILGFFGARARHALGERRGGEASVEVGAGALTSLALARLAVSEWPSRPPLAVLDAAAPVTFRVGEGQFVTVRPWASLAIGPAVGGDEGIVTLLGRTALSGAGARVTGEAHLSRRLALVGAQDVGVDAYGGYARLATRTTGAVVLAGGPLRLNAGLVLNGQVPFTGRGGALLRVGPAFDVWARW